MNDFIVYGLQVNVGIVLFYLLYRLLFVRDTFFGLRRIFLLAAVGISFAYPFVSIDHWLETKEPIRLLAINYAGLFEPEAATDWQDVSETLIEKTFLTPENVLMAVWLLACSFFLGRLFMRLCSVLRLRRIGVKQEIGGTHVFALPGEVAPFSFFGWIFLNPSLFSEKDIREIITHEKTHTCQCHSLDVMTGEMLAVLFWFNPFVWLMLFEIRQNLEFIADQKVLASGYDRKTYQYHLLQVSYQSAAAQIINNFNVSQLKKRIVMMNKKKTSKFGVVRYALLVPMAGILILTGNAVGLAQSSGEEVAVAARSGEGDVKVTLEKGKPSPWFPGGIQAMLPFFSENMKHSPEVIEAKVKGEVRVKFTVSKAGDVTNPTILKGIHPYLDREVLRVVETMSAWKPAEEAGQKVAKDVELVLLFSRPDGAGNTAAPSVRITGMNTENFEITLKDPALAAQKTANYHLILGQEPKEGNFVVVTSKSENTDAFTAKTKEISVYPGDLKDHFVIVETGRHKKNGVKVLEAGTSATSGADSMVVVTDKSDQR